MNINTFAFAFLVLVGLYITVDSFYEWYQVKVCDFDELRVINGTVTDWSKGEARTGTMELSFIVRSPSEQETFKCSIRSMPDFDTIVHSILIGKKLFVWYDPEGTKNKKIWQIVIEGSDISREVKVDYMDIRKDAQDFKRQALTASCFGLILICAAFIMRAYD